MTLRHKVSVVTAIIVAVILILGILFGANVSLYSGLKVDRNVRDLCIALWAFLGSAWFTLESQMFKPKGVKAVQDFYEGQRKGQIVVAFLGTIIALIIGTGVGLVQSTGSVNPPSATNSIAQSK